VRAVTAARAKAACRREGEGGLLAEIAQDDSLELARRVGGRDEDLGAGDDGELLGSDVHRQALVGRPVGILEAETEAIDVADDPELAAAVARLLRADERREQEEIDLARLHVGGNAQLAFLPDAGAGHGTLPGRDRTYRSYRSYSGEPEGNALGADLRLGEPPGDPQMPQPRRRVARREVTQRNDGKRHLESFFGLPVDEVG